VPRAKPRDGDVHAYDTQDLQRLFGLPAAAVRSLTRAGHLSPVRRAGRLNYSFRDLVVLRTASALRAANIPAKRINRSLRTLRDALPGGETLRQLSLTALGDQIAVRDGQLLWESDSGQYLLALDVKERPAELHAIGRSKAAAAPATPVDEQYRIAFALEESDPGAAIAAYRVCLIADAGHTDARVNLGRLLHLAGRLEEAEQVYRATPSVEPLIAFNLAVLLDDLGRASDAIAAYRESLALDPQLADAHFNLARLYEQQFEPKASLRHLLAYRRMLDQQGT
jgi:tetratricopeptide (TPR) repeat protein